MLICDTVPDILEGGTGGSPLKGARGVEKRNSFCWFKMFHSRKIIGGGPGGLSLNFVLTMFHFAKSVKRIRKTRTSLMVFGLLFVFVLFQK